MKLECPKCGAVVETIDDAEAWCSHGKPYTRFNPLIEMVPTDKETK